LKSASNIRISSFVPPPPIFRVVWGSIKCLFVLRHLHLGLGWVNLRERVGHDGHDGHHVSCLLL
jgi:hypothetical protein